MGLFEVLFKRRKFLPIHERLWQVLSPHLGISVGPEDDADGYRRECFFYAGVVYASVYQAALSAGMSTSTGFSLARIQLRKCPFDSHLLDEVDAMFTADMGSEERQFADRLLETVGEIAAGMNGAGSSPSVEAATALQALQQFFSGLGFLPGSVSA